MWTTIQKGIDNLTSQDTLIVKNGIYSGDIVLNKSITVRGENPEETIIYGSVISSYSRDYELPNNKATDPITNVNMTGNEVLLHFNNEGSVGENYSNSSLIHDYTGQENNGLKTININWNASTIKGAGAFDFNGYNDFVKFTPTSSFTGENVTASSWIYWHDGYGAINPIISQLDNQNNGYCLFINGSTNKPVFQLNNTVAESFVVIESGWHNIVGTHNKTVLKIYVDGVLCGTALKEGNGINKDMIIGFDNNSHYFQGTLDEIAVWNRTLSANEILRAYQLNYGVVLVNLTIDGGEVGIIACNNTQVYNCKIINQTIGVQMENVNNVWIKANISNCNTGIRINNSNPDMHNANTIGLCNFVNCTNGTFIKSSSNISLFYEYFSNCTNTNLIFNSSSISGLNCTSDGNVAPYTPSLSGPIVGNVGTLYTYYSVTNDSDNDQLYYQFFWGDENSTGVLGPYSSNETINASHTWNMQGGYYVWVIVKDPLFNESWSESLLFRTETLPPAIHSIYQTADFIKSNQSITITANVSDDTQGNWSGIMYVGLNITYPDNSTQNFSMNSTGNNTYIYNFPSTMMSGQYQYHIWVLDKAYNSNTSIPHIFTVDTVKPMITNVTASPDIIGFGSDVNITTDITDDYGITLVSVNISYPNALWQNYTLNKTSGDTYCYKFLDTWVTGQYNYTIWATDNAGNMNNSCGHHFHVSAQATMSIATLKNSYSGTQYINITDPPNPPENLTLVDRGLTWNTYYYASSGENILETYQGPVNYQEDNGTWTPINNTITQLASNHPAYVYGYRSGNNRGLYGAYFKSNAQQEWPVAFTYNKSNDPTFHAVRSKLVGVGYVDPQSNWAFQYLQNVQSSQGQTNDFSITYPGVFTGTDVTWSCGNTGLKEEITLSNVTKSVLQSHPPSQYGLNDASSYLVFITKLDYQNLNLWNGSGVLDGNVTISDAGVDFKDVLGQFKCALPLGEAYELNNESARQKLTYRIIHLNGNTYLLSGVKVSDLNAMTFPVVVDPTLTVYSTSSDGYIYKSGSVYSTVQSASSGTVDSSSSYISIGQKKVTLGPTYYVYRGFVFFNTSTLPSNAYLDNATLSIYKKDDYSTTDFDITIQNGQPTYPRNPMQTGDYFRNYYSGNGGTLGTSRFTSGYNAITMSNLSWINKTGFTKLCLRSSRDISGTAPTGNEYVNVYSNEFLGMNPPKLVINYRNQSKIKNTGSTDIKGYLLIQVQLYNSTQGKWLVDNNTINETTSRTITSGNHLALDTIFNGHVRASDLTHATGTYRIYAAFRDPEGNILRTDDDVYLEVWWQFSKT